MPALGSSHSSEVAELEQHCAGLVRDYGETAEVRKRNTLSVRLEAMPRHQRRRVCEVAGFYNLDSDESPDPEPQVYVTLRINRHRPPKMPTVSLASAARRRAQELGAASRGGAGQGAVTAASSPGAAGREEAYGEAWSCGRCTFRNEEGGRACAVCGAERPAVPEAQVSAWSGPRAEAGPRVGAAEGAGHTSEADAGDADGFSGIDGDGDGGDGDGGDVQPLKYKHSVLKINRPVQAPAEEEEPLVLRVEPAEIPQADQGGSTQFDALEDEYEDEYEEEGAGARGGRSRRHSSQPHQRTEIAVDEVCCICLDELQTVERANRGEELSVYEACKHAIHASCAKQLRAAQVASKQADGEGHTGGTTMLEIKLGAHGAFTCPLCRTVSRGFVDVTLRTSAVRSATKGAGTAASKPK